MGLFGSKTKKKEEEKPLFTLNSQPYQSQTESPELPEFPSPPEEGDSFSEFPTYEPTISDIKKEVRGETDEEYNIPVRNHGLSGKKMVGASSAASLDYSKEFEFKEEKPLFVRIDAYKEVMHSLHALKAKLEDAEQLFRALEEIKAQEQDKLDEWKKDLQNIKEKLISIDKDLFEV